MPDHPWVKGSERAAVRIAMTVAVRGERPGKLAKVAHESELNSDTPNVQLESDEGKITANLRLGADVSKVVALISNEDVSSPGVKLHGSGFIVEPKTAANLGLGRIDSLDRHIVRYRNGRDIGQRPRGVMVIDLFGLSIDEVQSKFPAVYQHILETVKPERDQNNRESYRKNWWVFGEARSAFRPALKGLDRYIATIETAAQRFFQFLEHDTLPDNMLVNVAISRGAHLATLSSRAHWEWVKANASSMGAFVGPARWTKTRCFDPFPFPTLTDAQSARLDGLGERLDAFRKERLTEHDFLTMTDMYNVLERLRELEGGAEVEPLAQKEKDIHEAGLISVLKDIHDEIDREVFAAYGWEDLGERLVGRPGATTPTSHKSEDQEEAEEELLTRLVALNQERAAEEKRGLVRWLRPNFQIPRLGHKVSGSEQVEADLGEAVLIEERQWPADGLEQIRTVRDVLAEAEAPLPAEALATLFKGRTTAKRKARVTEVLQTLVATGAAREAESGFFLPS
ncbi:DNA methyltransferase family protein [Erythrobacter insulae]|uniref:hypothetical protein n=1 Tax=Erythrobacter insulae TaxID=2584124 RepID=UPI0018F8BA1D|nr:hypothetical protein [Erythrobacter insulae]